MSVPMFWVFPSSKQNTERLGEENFPKSQVYFSGKGRNLHFNKGGEARDFKQTLTQVKDDRHRYIENRSGT